MSFLRFTHQTCFAALLSCSLIAPTIAADNEDPLGEFLAKQLAIQENNPYAAPRLDQPNYVHQQTNSNLSGLSLLAKSALIMNANTGQVLYHKNMDAVRPIASISKLLAAMVVLDGNLDMSQPVTITDAEIDRLKGTRSRLTIGTTLTRQQLLHIGLMSSENRAMHALGRTYPGGMAAFVQAMNDKARSLGMNNSRFYEPTGLDPRNVSTARDLSIMVRAANQYPQIRQLSTAHSGWVYTHDGRVINYGNTNPLVHDANWNVSVQKTGNLNEAGQSMVLQAQVGRESVVIVVLGSKTKYTRVSDARALGSIVSPVF
ncbi:MAG: serine hydrolase [Alysiella sp.]|uniref:serine hydrolase n=1 Tax=Alysiella sp. TaxID=1872483 RepID=UPI0026DBDA7D|nr:serine hydrolase [Alysiella sp.]MDO4434743.1 serine hydrolase [Alysiella sp.]